jgi:rhodanese-related sulfurtransferase
MGTMRKNTSSQHQQHPVRRFLVDPLSTFFSMFFGMLFCVFFMLHAGAAQALSWPFGDPTWADTKQLVRKSFPKAPVLSVPQLQAWLADSTRPQPLLLDVRSPAEFADSHLAHARQANDANAAQAVLVAQDKSAPVVVYCSVGYRSGKVVEALLKRGHTQVWNLEGSLFEWANSGLPVVRGDQPASTVHPYDKTWGVLLKRELWSRPP